MWASGTCWASASLTTSSLEKRYYLRAVLEPTLLCGSDTITSDLMLAAEAAQASASRWVTAALSDVEQAGTPEGWEMPSREAGWEFRVEGTGFQARLRVELDAVPRLESSPAPHREINRCPRQLAGVGGCAGEPNVMQWRGRRSTIASTGYSKGCRTGTTSRKGRVSYYGLGSRSRLGLLDRELMKDPNEPRFSLNPA